MFPCYAVSTSGRVRSEKWLKKSLTIKIRVLTPRTVGAGYHQVILSVNGKDHPRYVHRLVAETFLKKVQGKPEVNHIDGNKKNNSVKNLEWISHRENIRHSNRRSDP